MRSIKLLLVSAMVCLVVGCASIPAGSPAGPEHGPTVEGAAEVGLRFVRSGGKEVVVEFDLTQSNYTHVVQEITLDSGEVLVECFRNDRDTHDYHRWSDVPHSRRMVYYAANCVGVDERWGFGHLPDNGLGVYTTVGPDFNRSYQESHRTQGYIQSRAPNEYVWTIEADTKGGILVVINGVEYK